MENKAHENYLCPELAQYQLSNCKYMFYEIFLIACMERRTLVGADVDGDDDDDFIFVDVLNLLKSDESTNQTEKINDNITSLFII